MRILKGLGLFLSSLGVSLVVGWWLAERERAKGQTAGGLQGIQGAISVAPMMSPSTQPMSEPAIVLPREAFEIIENEPPTEKLIRQASAEKPTAKVSSKPEKVAKPKQDDLTIIKGIGPKKADAFANIGITTFAELAAANAEELKEKMAGVGSVEQLEEWIAAAKEFKS